MNRRAELVDTRSIELSESPIPEAPPQGMVIKVHCAGVCHTDTHIWTNENVVEEGQKIKLTDIGILKLPRVLGHEIAGEVHSIGQDTCPGSDEFQIGDRVLLYPWVGCGECGACKTKRYNICPKMGGYGLLHHGGFQTYVSVFDRKSVMHLIDAIPMDVACMLPCSALTAFNSISKTKPVIEESIDMNGTGNLVLVGAGALGLWALKFAKCLLSPQTHVYMIDIVQEKLDEAKRQGADSVVLWTRDMSGEEVKKSMPDVDAVIDFVGNTSTTANLQSCIRLGGMHILIGIAGGSHVQKLLEFIHKQINMFGLLCGTPMQLKELMGLVATGKVQAPPTTMFSLEDLQQVLTKLEKGDVHGRGVLDFRS